MPTTLDAARQIELLVALVWEARSHLAQAPWRRTRRRARREFKRLAGALGDLQARVLNGGVVTSPAALQSLDALLHDALATPPAMKSELKALRRAIRDLRREISEAIAA